MALQIIRNNIINVEADAIVNTANPEVAVGRGVDFAIYEAAGWDDLFEARQAIGPMKPGDAACTPAFRLDAKYIIHTVGPAWKGGGFGERETVAACYRNSLELAGELGCESIAFPLIATGTYGFPKDEALRIAINEISAFLLGNEMEVLLVVFDRESFRVSGKLFSEIREFIEADEAVYRSVPRSIHGSFSGRSADARKLSREYTRDNAESEPVEEILESKVSPSFDDIFGDEAYPDFRSAPDFHTAGQSLDERLLHLDKTFQEYLFMLIDRKHFSKIRSNADYMPSKRTALALALALELSLDETKDLLSRAGLALSPSILSDRIIEHCIDSGNYDIYEINCILFNYDQPMLGA